MLITLYILNHNYGRFIQQAIDSALQQNYSDYEIIILDDGSSDNSREIIEQYRDKPRIRIIYQENKGLMPSINRAWKEAKGAYIMRLDADDTICSDMLTRLVSYAKSHPTADWIFPGFYTTDAYGVILGQENRGNKAYFIANTERPPHGACSLIKRETLKALGGYSEKVTCRDGLDLFMKLKKQNTILSVPEYLFYYRRHNNNLTLNKKLIESTELTLRSLEVQSEAALLRS